MDEWMRSYIAASQQLTLEEDELTEDAAPVSHPDTTLLEHDLECIVFKLRAFLESSDGDYALGVEAGMQRAADMIENVLRRHRENNLGH
jgi:hypothetical protein